MVGGDPQLPANDDEANNVQANDVQANDVQANNIRVNQTALLIQNLGPDAVKTFKRFRDEYNKPEQMLNKDYVRQMAAMLPGVANGIVGIANGARQTPQDAIAISAGVMDLLGGVSQAAPPPFGALIGSLFSLVSILLKGFAPKPDDMLTKIEKTIRTIVAENKRDDVKTGYDTLKKYANIIDDVMTWATPDPGKMSGAIKDLNLMEGKTIWVLGAVRSWLGNPKNEDLHEWPEIFKVLCDSYLQLFVADMRQSTYTRDFENYAKYNRSTSDDKALQKDWVELMAGAKWVKEAGHDEGKHSTEFKNWKKLVDAVWRKEEQIKEERKLLAEFLKDIIPVVRKKGLYVIAYAGAHMYVATGTKAFTENKFKLIRDHCHRMSIAPPSEGVSSPESQYHVWVLDSQNGDLTHDRLALGSHQYSAEVVQQNIIGEFLDLWPEPATGAEGKFKLYASSPGNVVQRRDWDRSAKTFRFDSGWMLKRSERVSQIRVAAPGTFDADLDPVSADFKRSDGYSIIYGRLDGSRHVLVDFSDEKGPHPGHLVEMPMESYSGIAVDRYLLWVYGPSGFVCASHASILSTVKGKRKMPRWLGHGHPNGIGSVNDLASCEDGTLLVSTPNGLVTAPYRIDFETVKVNERDGLILGKWENLIAGGNAARVQKLPIFGWPQIQSLMGSIGDPKDYVTPQRAPA